MIWAVVLTWGLIAAGLVVELVGWPIKILRLEAAAVLTVGMATLMWLRFSKGWSSGAINGVVIVYAYKTFLICIANAGLLLITGTLLTALWLIGVGSGLLLFSVGVLLLIYRESVRQAAMS